MEQALFRILGTIGGGTAAFYALGYTIVQSYTYKLELEGMFWLTREFYTEAGAKFLLEAIRAPFLVPQVFVPYILVLWLLVRQEDAPASASGESAPSRRQWLRPGILLAIIAITYVAILYYGKLVARWPFRELLYYAIPNLANARAPRATPVEHSLMFFNLVTPVAVSCGVFLYRRQGFLRSDVIRRVTYRLVLIASVVLIAVVPISYGFYIYDWRIVLVEEPVFLKAVGGSEGEDIEPSKVMFLGRFEDRYVFLTEHGAQVTARIETLEQQAIKHLKFNLKRSGFLRDELDRGVNGVVVKADDLEKALQLEERRQ